MIRSLVVNNVIWERRARLYVALFLVMVAAMVVGYTSKAYAAPGYLDPSFDTDGKLTTDFSNNFDFARDVALQEDGKIVVAGYTDAGSAPPYHDFTVARYNLNGTLDTSFGAGGADGDGKVTTAVTSGDVALAVAVRADGKIVVAGYTYNGSATGEDFAVTRYNANGTLDTSFSGDGIVVTALGTGYDQANGLALQGNKVLVAGYTYNGSTASGGTSYDFALVRYDDNGNLDSTFGTGGVVKTDFFGSSDYGNSVVVQQDGNIVVAGRAYNGSTTSGGTERDFALARYTASGALDTTFDGDGKATTHFGSGDDTVDGLAIQEDGKIVAAGNAHNGSNIDFGVARYRTNGSLDGEFGTNGKAMIDFGSSDSCWALALQEDGRMVLAGHSDYGASSDFALARLNDDGSLNTSFHNDGKLKTDFASDGDVVSGVEVQEDGKIVAAGGATHSTTGPDFAVARYFGGDDATKPVVRPPTQSLITNSTLGTSTTSASVPTRISWSATDSEGVVTRYQLQKSTNGGAYTNVSLPRATTTSITPSLTPASNYRFRVRATDDNGNTSFFKYGPRFTVAAHQETSTAIAYTGTWTRQALSGSYGGAVKYATASGATAKLTFTGRSVTWGAPKSNTRGKAEVYLDGVRVAIVDLYSSTALSRRVIYSANGLNPSVSHTLQVKVLGTTGRPRVDVDAFVVLR